MLSRVTPYVAATGESVYSGAEALGLRWTRQRRDFAGFLTDGREGLAGVGGGHPLSELVGEGHLNLSHVQTYNETNRETP